MKGQQRRKLLRIVLLAKLWEKHQLGVPAAKLVRDHKLHMSSAHLTKLIQLYDLTHDDPNGVYDNVKEAINPEWLNTIDDVQKAPSNYKYKGFFPQGKWVRV